MKYWVALGLLLISTTAYAETLVEVEGYGRTKKEAKQDACDTAIKQVVGQVIVSDRETNGDRLTKDFIGSYSAGSCRYSDSDVLETRYESNRVVVKMNVVVVPSKIAERMLVRGRQDLIIDGDSLQSQIESEFDRRSRGDQLILHVLDSYPHNAFLLNSGRTEFKISDRRQSFIEIPFAVEMNPIWLTSFSDALNLVSAKNKTCGTWSRILVGTINNNKIKDRMACGQIPDLRVGDNNYYFYDQETLRLINSELQPKTGHQRIALHVDIQNAGGESVDHRCTDVNTETFIKYNQPQGVVNMNDRDMILRPNILEGKKIVGVLNINLSNIQDFGEISKIRLTVGKTCT